MIYCENVVKILWTCHLFFFLLLHRFRNLFLPPPPIFGNAIATIAKKKKNLFIPLFREWHCHNQFVNFFFFFSLWALHAHPSSIIGHRKFNIPIAKIQHFLSPPFSSSLLFFWLNFGNGNTEIQSFSSKSQIALNSSYNAN